MKIAVVTILLCVSMLRVAAQEAGSSVYRADARLREPQVNTGVLTGQIEPGKQVQFIESSVLMNVPAEAYVAVFGFVQEGQVPAISNATVNARFAEFVKLLDPLGVRSGDIYVDYISQNRVFDFTETGNTVTEKLAGFETKKNIAVRYKDPMLLERILAAAGKATIFDLIEVDYVVADTKAIRARLFDEAVKVLKQKEMSYKALGIAFAAGAVANEKYDVFFPGGRYQAYQAFESGAAYNAYNKTVIRPRKVTTFYYHPVTGEIFDTVVNPIGIEPMVQFTLYLRIQGAVDTKK